MEQYENFYYVVSQCLVVGTFLLTSVFLYIFLKYFVKKNISMAASLANLVIVVVLYYIPPVISNLSAYGLAMLGVLLVLLVGEHGKIRQKIFLCVTFFVLRSLAMGAVMQLMILINQLTNSIPYLMSDILIINITFVVSQVFQLMVEIVFLHFSVKLFLGVYKRNYDELSTKEFIMLLMPMLAQVMGYQSVSNYYALYDKAMIEGIIEPVNKFNTVLFIYYLASYIVILTFLTFYQDLKEKQEEKKEQELFTSQMQSMKQHIQSVEEVYSEVRSLRHDMANHLMTLEGLYKSGSIDAADEYARKISDVLDSESSNYKSGNPVTDVILHEYMKKFGEKNIQFVCNFNYPDTDKIDAFDMSVVLGNALENAYEAVCNLKEAEVSLRSHRKKNAFIIEISNTYSGMLNIDEFTGLPITSKEEAPGHGYGLKNIRRVAQKAYGDIKVEMRDGKFVLNLMMMLQ